MPVNYSLYKISDANQFAFSAEEYSRFKFGDEKIAKKFGFLLCEAFINDYLMHQSLTQQIVVVSSPYSFIPTATFALKNYFTYKLNRWLAANGLPVSQETKVHRTTTYKEDYGELSAEERIKLIGNDSFHIDKEFLTGKMVIFLDDIKITGSHEKMISKMLSQYELSNDIIMLYFAELVNKEVHPNVENFLNYYSVKTIFDLNKIIKGEKFLINTRIVKYILHYPFETFVIFVQNQSKDFINLLYDMALGNNYHLIEAYAQNLQFIKNHFINNVLKTIHYGD